MGLLTPLYLLGLAAISLPILFHMIRRVPRGKYPFSTIRFLTPSPPTITRRSRIEHWLLLLLRATAISLLAFAFARPYLRDAEALGVDPSQADRAIVLLDTSASMRRADLWTQATANAAEVIQQADLDDTVGVYAFDRELRPVMTMEEWSELSPELRATEAVRRVQELAPSWNDTSLDAALISLADLLSTADLVENSAEITGRRRIILVSDLQEGSHLDALQGFEWPTQVQIELRRVNASGNGNASLEWIEAGDDEDSSSVAKIRVYNSADSPRQRFEVTVTSEEEGLAPSQPCEVLVPPGGSRVVSLPIEATPIDSEVAPESPEDSVTSTADRHGEKSDLVPWTFHLSGDDETFDNDLFVVRRKPSPPRVLFLGAADPANSKSAWYFLMKAFLSEGPAGLLALNPASTLPGDEFPVVDLIIVASALPDAWIEPLRNRVGRGESALLVLLDSENTKKQLGGLLGIEGVSVESRVAADYAMLSDIDFQHPLFAPFRDTRFSDFTKIRFFRYQAVDASQLPQANVLAKFDDGTAALIECRHQRGRIYVLTTTWEPADSQLALSSKFVPLLWGLCGLTGGGDGQTKPAYWTGDTISVGEFAQPADGQVQLIGPDGNDVEWKDDSATIVAELPGIYTVKAGSEVTRFAVNPHPRESRTAPLDTDRLAQLGVPLNHEPTPREETVRRESQRQLHAAELEGRHKLWRWLALAVLGILVGESFLAGRAARRSS